MIKKRSVTVAGHSTSVSLEEPFWIELKKIADKKSLSLNQLIESVDNSRIAGNLSSALRIFVLREIKNEV